jgi:hypothetical protein
MKEQEKSEHVFIDVNEIRNTDICDDSSDYTGDKEDWSEFWQLKQKLNNLAASVSQRPRTELWANTYDTSDVSKAVLKQLEDNEKKVLSAIQAKDISNKIIDKDMADIYQQIFIAAKSGAFYLYLNSKPKSEHIDRLRELGYIVYTDLNEYKCSITW